MTSDDKPTFRQIVWVLFEYPFLLLENRYLNWRLRSPMRLWHLRCDKKIARWSYCGSWSKGVIQLWLGTHIFQLVIR